MDNHIFIALCAALFYWAGSIIYSGSSIPDWPTFSLVFFSTVLTYHIVTQTQEDIAALLNIKNWKTTLGTVRYRWLVILIVILCLHLPFFVHDWKELIFLGHLGIISLFYNTPTSNNPDTSLPLRNVPLLKIFLISYVWASLGAVLPLFALSDIPSFAEVLKIFIAHALFILAICIPFDIRDYYRDKHRHLVTIPGTLGQNKSKVLATICFVLAFFLHLDIIRLWPYLTVFSLITLTLIWMSNLQRPRLYFTGLMDGLIILYFFAVYFTEFL